jgi:hypothetical protein
MRNVNNNQKEKQMKVVKQLAVLILTSSLFGGVVSGEGNKAAEQTTLTGIVSDSMCGAKHMAKDKSAAACTRECIKSGSDYALVVGGKVYSLKGDKAELDKYAGQPATVKGTLEGNNLNVQSITGAKKAATSAGKMDHPKMDGFKAMGQMDQGAQRSQVKPSLQI